MSYSKYYLYKKQVSYDNGITWSDTLETVPSGNPIATYSTLADCEAHDYPLECLTFVAEESGTFTFTPRNSNVISYSTDNGSTWTQGNSVSVSAGDKVFWKGTMTSDYYGVGTFSSTGRFHVEGNAMSLLYGDNFIGQTSLNQVQRFIYLFDNCSHLTSAENMILPATTLLADECYYGMFRGCTNLTTAPSVLPATTLAYWCYSHMFDGCTSLTTAPELPATTLSEYCYVAMFYNCTSLTTAPELPATTLDTWCYWGMFSNCTNLTTAPSLPATTLSYHCYQDMFNGCTSLTTAPELPATRLADGCYVGMFKGCTSLTIAPVLSATTLTHGCYEDMFNGSTSLTTAPQLLATTLASFCYYSMFYGCTSLTTAPELPATTLADYCYAYMFQGCTMLNYIKSMATDISATDCTKDWVDGVASAGTFIKDCDTNWTTGVNGIPNGWNVSCDYSTKYLTFIAEENCTFSFTDYNIYLNYSTDGGETWTQGYEVSVNSGQKVLWKSLMSWFSGSKVGTFSSTGRFHVEGNVMSLVYGDEFNEATSLSGRTNIFSSLFSGCTTLTSAENMILPATTLSQSCYASMFSNCTSLTTAPSVLPATTLANQCYIYMFYNCTSLTTAPVLLATTLTEFCYNWMFVRCTSLNNITCLATDVSANRCTNEWVNGVAATGTFTKAASMTGWGSCGTSKIPCGWTVVDAT